MIIRLALQTAPLPPVARPTIVAVSALYFAVVAVIAVWAARRTRTSSDFFIA